jgi:hypothetical protein
MHSDPGARHAKVFVKSTHKTGYLLETNLVPETVGAINAIKDIPFALKLARAGKVPNPLRAHSANKLDEVRKLHTLIDAQEKAARAEATAGPRRPPEEAQAKESE